MLIIRLPNYALLLAIILSLCIQRAEVWELRRGWQLSAEVNQLD